MSSLAKHTTSAISHPARPSRMSWGLSISSVVGIGIGVLASFVVREFDIGASKRPELTLNNPHVQNRVKADPESISSEPARVLSRIENWPKPSLLTPPPVTNAVERSNEEPPKIAASKNPSLADEARISELKEVRRALPFNSLVPGNRSKAELEQYMDEIQEQQQLSVIVNGTKASEAERLRYYDLQAKRYEDEIELAEYCDKLMGEIRPNDAQSHPFCTEVASRAEETKQANSTTLVALQKELHLDSVQ